MTTVHDKPDSPRCKAAHVDDTSACDGPADAVRIVDQTGTEVAGCVHHGAVLLASLDGGRVYPGSVKGAAIEVFKATQQLKPFAFDPPLSVVRTRVVRLPAEDLLDAFTAALLGDQAQLRQLRDEPSSPEPVLDTVPDVDLEQALALAADMVAANPEVGDRQRVKIVSAQ